MAKNANDKTYLMTKPGILTHPNVITPRAFGKNPKPDAKKSYSCSFTLDADNPDVAPMKGLIMEAAKAMFPGLNIVEEVKAGRFKVPFSSGDKLIANRKKKLEATGKEYKGDADFMAGKIVFKASSDFPPALGVRVNGQVIDLNDDNRGMHKDKFYFGSLGFGGFTFRPYEPFGEDGKPGVKMYLDTVFSLNSGKRLATGGRSAAEAFAGVAGSVVTEDPTTGPADTLDDDAGGEVF